MRLEAMPVMTLKKVMAHDGTNQHRGLFSIDASDAIVSSSSSSSSSYWTPWLRGACRYKTDGTMQTDDEFCAVVQVTYDGVEFSQLYQL